jgi:2-oxoglutarate ferredoxin oxidoreductase subunit beta
MAEIIHAANRGENYTTIFVNNTVYGMTGGQMAPTTLAGQKTTTSPRGRDVATEGHPFHMCELLSQLESTRLLVRTTVCSPRRVRETKRMLKKAFRNQMEGVGFSMVEVLSPCPTYWRKTPSECRQFIEQTMTKTFPLGVVKDSRPDTEQNAR